jgi:hypothetical protein
VPRVTGEIAFMLCVGSQLVRVCGGVSRRELLRAGSLAALGLSLPQLLRATANAQTKPRARSLILLWLWGGPSHLDTFDLKPKAPLEYRGPYAPIATRVPGIEICELLPELAARADKYTIIRSLNHNSNDHGIGGTIGLTGSDAGAISLGGQVLPGQLKPTHGSIVSRVLRSRSAAGAFQAPPFVTLGGHLHQGKKAISGEGAAVLGPLYDPFRLDYNPEQGVKIPDLMLVDGVTPQGLGARRELLRQFDQLVRRIDHSPAVERLDDFYQQAFSLLTSGEARRMFNLDEEPPALRLRYGEFRFGQCCLLARRLVEAGVRFVQVNWSSHVEPVEDTGDGGWDMHDRNFQQFQDRHAWMLDQAASALLDDLAHRGLLSETIVLALGEFGRTPKINDKSGRDHWNQCYSALVAGGGVRAGQVIGASDKHAEFPVSRAVTPGDLFTTVLRQLGIETTDVTQLGLTPVGEEIEELF